MAYTKPTPSDFKTRFPTFASVDDARVQIFLDDAANNIDDSWLEKDYSPAIQYLAAHLLAVDDGTDQDAADVDGTGPITSESFQGMSVSYSANTLTAAQKSIYGSTSYGRRYFNLLTKNKPAILVVK